ncbi:MAG: pyridoxamine 5'-phosphate oxidase family protein [Candidatus Omnitrophica bacterium]|nr:pyridoxamine 5'-phosphate oxidase family protein [Candidatus Omnitrophota bacterium]
MTKDEVFDIISDAGYAILGTVEGDQPKVRPMAPYLHENQLLTALVPNARTISQIKKNPNVEACFVDRKMCFCRVSGKGKISNDLNKKQILWDNVPNLRQYFSEPADPNFTLLEIDITNVEAMNPYQTEPEKIKLFN